jgi:hypothetical protein
MVRSAVRRCSKPAASTPRVFPSAATTLRLIVRQYWAVEEDVRQKAKSTAVATAAFRADTRVVPMTLITGRAHRIQFAARNRMGRLHAVKQMAITMILRARRLGRLSLRPLRPLRPPP